MGNTIGKIEKGNTDINDYSIVSVPKNYTLLKIISYCIDLRLTANTDLRITEITNYIMSSTKKKDADIINLHSIHDILSLHLLVREIKQWSIDNDVKLYFAPDFDNINEESKSDGSRNGRRSKNLEEFATGSKRPSVIAAEAEELCKGVVHNIIISKYEIIGTICAELDNKTNMDDIFGIQMVIGANILVNGLIISIYNASFSKDIRMSNIINDSVRTTEMETLCDTINKNKKNLQTCKYPVSGIHLIVGNLNIPEITNDNINAEYINTMVKGKCIDIFRYKYTTDFGYTTSYKERGSYMLLHLGEDIYNIIKDQDRKNVLNYIFKKYKIHFMDLYVVTTIKNPINYPIECVCMLKTN